MRCDLSVRGNLKRLCLAKQSAVELVLPPQQSAAVAETGNGAQGLPGLASFDFVKHCLTIHNKAASKVHIFTAVFDGYGLDDENQGGGWGGRLVGGCF